LGWQLSDTRNTAASATPAYRQRGRQASPRRRRRRRATETTATPAQAARAAVLVFVIAEQSRVLGSNRRQMGHQGELSTREPVFRATRGGGGGGGTVIVRAAALFTDFSAGERGIGRQSDSQ